METEKKFRFICTGRYTYRTKETINKKSEIMQSHCIYGLDDEGIVWKWQVKANCWVLLTDTGKYDTD